MRATSRGFTLIELMIAVAVVAILASIAIPTYKEAVRKGRRGQAQADLVEFAQVAERWRSSNGTYATVPGFPRSSPKSGTAYYTVALSNGGANTFTLTATPIATTDQVKDKCGVLTITHTGARHHQKGTTAECKFGTVGP